MASGLVSRYGANCVSKKLRKRAGAAPFRVLASSQAARQSGHWGRLASARHDCNKGGKAALRSSSRQPGKSLHAAACSGGAAGLAESGVSVGVPGAGAAALRGGAIGYLLKTTEGDDLAAAIRRAMDGDSVVAPEMMSKLVAAYRGAASTSPSPIPLPNESPEPDNPGATLIASLSPRELDILRGIARGASNKEIARGHGIAETTVKIHVQHILRKLNVSSRVHAAVIASENGLL